MKSESENKRKKKRKELECVLSLRVGWGWKKKKKRKWGRIGGREKKGWVAGGKGGERSILGIKLFY